MMLTLARYLGNIAIFRVDNNVILNKHQLKDRLVAANAPLNTFSILLSTTMVCFLTGLPEFLSRRDRAPPVPVGDGGRITRAI